MRGCSTQESGPQSLARFVHVSEYLHTHPLAVSPRVKAWGLLEASQIVMVGSKQIMLPVH